MLRMRPRSHRCAAQSLSGPGNTAGRSGVLDTLRDLPASSVQIGSIQGYNQYTNGLGDPLDYIRALRPPVFVPAHHDNWLAPVSAPAAAYEPRLRQALGSLPDPPELRLLVDPAGPSASVRLDELA